MIGKSKNYPQPNQIEGQEAERGEQTLANVPQRGEETWDSKAVLLLPQAGSYC